jgi:alpha-beta hydrolase superfamily lysophospholipase
MPLSFYVRDDGEFLSARLWIPQKSNGAGVVFCHGWGGGAQYDDLLKLLSESGYFALRLQQRGYAGSTGQGDLSLWQSGMTAGAGILHEVVPAVWAAGQSTGGTIALIAAATQECFTGAISIAPFCTLERILQDNPNARAVLEKQFGPLEKRHFAAADALTTARGLQKPVLLVHGTEDRTVPIEHSRLLAGVLGVRTRFVPVSGGDHHLGNIDREALLTDIVDWLDGGKTG